ncbi:MAG: PAS domain S-box protein [Candidatus Thermoplasmatota archaeon]|nr:PAS domain S-box protein [Candidatus Thermoplasmatota archaeon]MBU1941749.1 PAS domain S-box protein [Candidatus Thermoplasmatota archaeon]
MRDEPDIVKELREAEYLGLFQSKVQGAYEELETQKEASDNVPDETVSFAEDDATEKKERVCDSASHEQTVREPPDSEIYRTLFENVSDEIIYVNKHGKIVIVNRRSYDLFGYKPEEIIGKNFLRLGWFGVRDMPKMLKLFKDAIRGKTIDLLELEVRHREGHIVHVEVSTRPVRKNGKTVGFLSIVRDITEHKQLEMTVREQQQSFIDVSKNIPVGLIIADSSGIITYVNDELTKITGYNADELVGMNGFNELTRPEDKEKYEQIMKRRMGNQPHIKKYERIIVKKDSTEVLTEFITTKTRWNGKICPLAIIRDITEQKKSEQEIRFLKEYNENIIESNPNAIMVVKGNKVEYVNNSFVSIFGKNKNEYISKNLREAISAEIFNAFKEQLQDNDSKIKELEIKGRNFSVNSFVVKKAEEEEEEEERIGILLQDITERKKTEEALKESEEKYKALYRTSADGILIADIETKRFRYANPALCKMLGYSEDELKEMGLNDIHPKDSLEQVISEFEIQAKGEKTLAEDIPCLRKDGMIIYADINTTVTLIDGKKCNVGFFRDITERKKAEQLIIVSEERYRDLFENAHDLIQSVNPDGSFVYVNRAWKELLGYNEDEIVDLNIFDIIHTEKKDHCMETFKRIMSGENIDRVEATFKTKDGGKIDVEGSINCRYMDGKPVSARGIFRDITDRKITEEKLRENEEKYSGFFKTSRDATFITSKEGRMIEGNDAMMELLGYKTKDELLKIGVSEHYENPEDRKRHIQIIEQQGYTKDYSVNLRKKDGRIINTLITSAVIKNKKGKVTGFQGTIRDITEKKRVEDKIRQQNIKLKKLDRVKSDFLNVTSHELRTPMSAIKGYIQMIMKQTLGNITEEQKKALNIVLRNTNRLDNLIQDILDISRLESGTMKFLPNPTDISTLAKEVVETMQSFADTKNIKIQLYLDNDLPTLTIDKDRIKQVIINLLHNAVKFSEPNSNIEVNGWVNSKRVELEVRDYGEGIPEREKEQVFKTFYQVDSGVDRKFGGAGLGLSISRGIVLAHGGNIWVADVEGKGASVQFSLPLKSVKNIEQRFKDIDIFDLKNKDYHMPDFEKIIISRGKHT